MKSVSRKKIFYFGVIGLTFIMSFCFYSSLYYPALNSDNAVTILMINYFKLPHDLYFWGQDRIGSLIPLVGQIPFKIFNLSALTSEAITHYTILLGGFLAFSTLLRSYFYRIVFAIIWFFPPMRLIDITQLPFGIHYSLIAIACYLFTWMDKENSKGNSILNHIVLVLLTVTIIATIWVSDMAIVSVFLLLGIQLLYYFKENKFSQNTVKTPHIYYAILGITIGYLFIHYAKSISPVKNAYSTLGDIKTIKQTIAIFLNTIWDLLLFKAKEPLTSIYTYLVMVIMAFSISISQKNKIRDILSNKWILFFLLDAIVLFLVIIISDWTYLNNVPRRYFTCTYISFSLFLLLVLDNLTLTKTHSNLIKILIVFTVILGGAGTIYNLKYIWPKTLTPTVKVVGEFQQLGNIGVISEYWNSYITSCVNPDQIKATPHEHSGTVRNYEIAEEVFMQKKIYVIKDMWLETFPDTLKQFGHVLIRDSLEFKIGNCDVCKYRKMD